MKLNFMETNGLTSEKFSEFSPGDKFIISPKGDKETIFTKPTEITIISIIKISHYIIFSGFSLLNSFKKLSKSFTNFV
jgi:hypothetical protein